MPEDVLFQRGNSSNTPQEKTPGIFTVQTDTGNMYLDISDTERIQIKDDTKLPLDGSKSMTGNLNMNNHVIQNVGNAVSNNDAVNLLQVTTKIKELSSSNIFKNCPANVNTITENGIYKGITGITYTNVPTEYIVDLLFHINDVSTNTDIQIAVFTDTTKNTQLWSARTFNGSLWSAWELIGGGSASFEFAPVDLKTITENGLYYYNPSAPTTTSMPTNATRLLTLIVSEDGKCFTGAFKMSDDSVQWFNSTRNNTTSTLTWASFIGESGGGGGELPPGGSPNTILVGTEESGVGAWTTIMPQAVVIDDGEID